MMKPFRELIDFDKAKKIILDETEQVERKEKVNILHAINRVLAENVVADRNIPGFDRAAVDGYAVMAEDTYGASIKNPKKLKIAGKKFAGETERMEVKSGECIQIATGAAMPAGSDAVIMVENVKVEGEYITITKPVYPGANVSPEDEDISKGDIVLNEGDILNPAKVGVLAALGMDSVMVYALPSIAIVPTGSELIPPGRELEYGKIYDINTYTLYSLLKDFSNVHVHEIVEDVEESMEECINSLLGMDAIIFSGGSSVGERDILAGIVEREGKVFFHGIALKPGKPTLFGKIGSTLVFGMPGYPTSCLTNAYTLLLPSIKKMARLPHEEKKGYAVLADKIVSTIGRYQIYTVRVKDGKAYPVFKESGAITSMSEANGYIEIPGNVEYIEEGSKVIVKYF